MSSNEKNEKEKISLENFNFESKTHRLNSPFSIKACKLKGVKEEDLYKLTLEEYVQLNPDSKNLPKDLVEERYSNYEDNRLKLIESLKEVRNKLLEKSGKKKQKKNKEKENQELNDEEEKDEDNNGLVIKNKENVKKYKKLKSDMELTIRVQIDREFEKEAIRRRNNAKSRKEEGYEEKMKKENEMRLK